MRGRRCGAPTRRVGRRPGRFETAVAAGDAPAAWEGLSRAAWWQGDAGDDVRRARAGVPRLTATPATTCGAARMAMWLGFDHLDFRGDDAVGRGVAAAGRAASSASTSRAPSTGLIALLEADIALLAPRRPRAPPRASRGRRSTLARAIADRELEVVALGDPRQRARRGGLVAEGVRAARRGGGAGRRRGVRRRARARAGRCATPSPPAPRSASSGAPRSGRATCTASRCAGRRGTSSASAAPPTARCSPRTATGRPPTRS